MNRWKPGGQRFCYHLRRQIPPNEYTFDDLSGDEMRPDQFAPLASDGPVTKSGCRSGSVSPSSRPSQGFSVSRVLPMIAPTQALRCRHDLSNATTHRDTLCVRNGVAGSSAP